MRGNLTTAPPCERVPTWVWGDTLAQAMPPRLGGGALASAVLYGADWCEVCKRAEAHLRMRGLTVIKKNTDQGGVRTEMFARLLTSSAQADMDGSIPVIDLGGDNVFEGFSAAQIDHALGLDGDPDDEPEKMPPDKPAEYDWNPFDDNAGFGAGLMGGGLGGALVVLAVLWFFSKGTRRG